MAEIDPVVLFIRKFELLGAPYMVSGSVASMAYGEVRFTRDIDLVADLNEQHLARIPEVFPSQEFYYPPQEAMELEISRPQRGHFNIIHMPTSFKADVYLRGRDPLNTWGFQRSQRVALEGESFVAAPPELVIIRKLEFYREGHSEKHLRDIRAMLLALPQLKYREELERIIVSRGLEEQWRSAQEFPEP